MWWECIEQCTDAAPCCFDGSFCGLSQEMFELGKDLLNRIEVGAIGRQEQQPGTSGPDRGANGRFLVAGEIVHDDDVAGHERRTEMFFDPCGEAGGVDRLIEHEGRIDPVAAEGCDEGHRFPVAVGHLGMEPLSDWSPASEGCHVGLGPGLVDENQAARIRSSLELLPLLATPGDLRAQLLGGKNAFF